MKRILFFLLLCIPIIVSAQTRPPLYMRNDSVFVGYGGNGELIIFNSTQILRVVFYRILVLVVLNL